MRADRFGSYSIAATLAGTPSFVRLKSILRYRRLCPPPWWRVVMRPLLLRPPLRAAGSRRLFSGSVFVISWKAETERKRRPGEVGLYLRRAMLDSRSLEDLDAVAFAKLDDGLLPAGLLAPGEAAPLRLRLHLEDVDGLDLHVEELFDGLPDLRLVRPRVHAKRVLVVLDQAVALLGDDRRDDDLAGVHQRSPPEEATVAGCEKRASPGRRKR